MRLLLYAFPVALAGAAACSSDGGSALDPGPGDTLVYESRGARQCESDGLTAEASAQKLINAGIDVLSSTCGYRTGVAFAAVCGGPTADILIHEIRIANLPDAERLGFAEVATLIDASAGTGYTAIDCEDRTPIATAP